MLIFIIGFQQAFSQDSCKIFFDEANTFYYEGKKDASILSFKKSFETCADSSQLYGKSIFNIASIYREENELNKAKKYFNKILKLDLNEQDPSGKAGMMSDPYANYKYNSCMRLYGIHLQEKDYDSCLYYLNLADTVYQYLDWSGTDIAIKKSKLKDEIGYTYGMKGDIKKSFELLIKKTEHQYRNSRSSIYFMEVLINFFGKNNFKNEFDLKFKKMKYPFLNLFDYEINIENFISKKDFKSKKQRKLLKEQIYNRLEIL